ncbi:MAG: hypothetical protein R6V17_05295 [Halanaerobacter sp.]
MVVNPINKLNKFSQEVSIGLIDNSLELEWEDQLSSLANNANFMLERLN